MSEPHPRREEEIIFLLSLPRSGSTLLQRVLASHPEVSTVPEPWILLPAFYATTDQLEAPYDQASFLKALTGLEADLPEGRESYWEALKVGYLQLYGALGDPSTQYFLDKTPRYHMIGPQLARFFPKAKYIILYRNPLAVAASMIEAGFTRFQQRDPYDHDLGQGPANLISTAEALGSRCIELRFEDLVSRSEKELSRLQKFLELQGQMSLDDAPVIGGGEGMGDPTGPKHYRTISSEPVAKWERTLATPLRRRWAQAYLDRLGDRTLQRMGYDPADLRSRLSDLPWDPRGVALDARDLVSSLAYEIRRGPLRWVDHSTDDQGGT
ncbi:MAG: sulfotransferase [Candidatus Thermoplasmatota archaeon]|nr:sulfotransferase [Candidatus Thermoplasmatota archaeon]